MASHVPFLAVRPEDQYATDVKLSSSSADTMDPRPEPPIVPTVTRIPQAIRFPAVCALSLSLSVLLHSITASITGLELATASRNATETWQVATLLGWKIVQLGGAWAAGYDCMFPLMRRWRNHANRLALQIKISPPSRSSSMRPTTTSSTPSGHSSLSPSSSRLPSTLPRSPCLSPSSDPAMLTVAGHPVLALPTKPLRVTGRSTS